MAYNAILKPTSIEFSKRDIKNKYKLLNTYLRVLKAPLNEQMQSKPPDYVKHIVKFHHDANNLTRLQYQHGTIME